jgi:hypothetical protein
LDKRISITATSGEKEKIKREKGSWLAAAAMGSTDGGGEGEKD